MQSFKIFLVNGLKLHPLSFYYFMDFAIVSPENSPNSQAPCWQNDKSKLFVSHGWVAVGVKLLFFLAVYVHWLRFFIYVFKWFFFFKSWGGLKELSGSGGCWEVGMYGLYLGTTPRSLSPIIENAIPPPPLPLPSLQHGIRNCFSFIEGKYSLDLFLMDFGYSGWSVHTEIKHWYLFKNIGRRLHSWNWQAIASIDTCNDEGHKVME